MFISTCPKPFGTWVELLISARFAPSERGALSKSAVLCTGVFPEIYELGVRLCPPFFHGGISPQKTVENLRGGVDEPMPLFHNTGSTDCTTFSKFSSQNIRRGLGRGEEVVT